MRTPLVRLVGPTHSQELFFKMESFQPVGSFKLRGAYNKIAALSPGERERGVITYSSGNHAQGVAFAARALGCRSVIVMPRNAPEIKKESTAALGAEIVLVGPSSLERQVKAEQLAAQHGYAIIPPFNDEKIIAGQGTIGLEILEDLPDCDLVLVPVGGGGLVSGIATALKLVGSKAKVVGVEPAVAADARQSLRSGKIVEITAAQAARTLADGLRTQRLGEITFEHIRSYVDDIAMVSEEEICQAMRRLALEAHLVVEPSGAVGFAAFLFRNDQLPPARRAVVVISGGNVEAQLLASILQENEGENWLEATVGA